jgi:GNAT superfamily N-acetyltransferase
MPDFTIGLATVDDAGIVARHRVGMSRDMGRVKNDVQAEQLLEVSIAVLASALGDGSYVGWLASDNGGRVLGGVGVHLKPQLPRIAPDGKGVFTDRVPLVVNVYTEPDARRRGVARALMRALMDWAKAHGCDRVLLHASEMGRPLYASLGFEDSNEMRWFPFDTGQSADGE